MKARDARLLDEEARMELLFEEWAESEAPSLGIDFEEWLQALIEAERP
jgi:hypothetical protein